MRSPRPDAAAPVAAHCAAGACSAGSVAPASPSFLLDLLAISPRGGPATGGTEVRLTVRADGAAAYTWGALIRCAFGEQSVEARRPDVTRSELRCIAPSVAVAGPVPLKILVRGSDRPGSAALAYRYYDPPAVRTVSPNGGILSGGTEVVVLGAGFGPYHADLGGGVALCRFGSEAATPRGSHGDDGDGGDDGGSPSVLRLVAPSPSDPPLRTHLPRLVSAPATIVHHAALRCRVPPAATPGAHAVEVSLNGEDFSRSSPRVAYHYFENWHAPRISGVAPSARGLHATARLGRSLFTFGGWGERRTALGGWANDGNGGGGGEGDDDKPGSGGPSVAEGASSDDGVAHALSTLHNDMHELRSSTLQGASPSVHASDVGWRRVRYSAYEQRPIVNTSLAFAAAMAGLTPPPAGAAIAPEEAGGNASRARTLELAPANAPRARSGHTLTAVGDARMLLFGGTAATHVEFPLAERYEVAGVKVQPGSD